MQTLRGSFKYIARTGRVGKGTDVETDGGGKPRKRNSDERIYLEQASVYV